MAYEEKKEKQTDEEILDDLRKNLVQCIDDEDEEREKMRDDLRFCTLDQWPADIRKDREGDTENGPRPCLTIDKINQYIVQVVNDMRQGKPGINPRPMDDKSDIETAKVLKGIIRNIEDQSNADVAYATAGENAAKIGLGYVRVVPEYVDAESFDQELRIKSIPNTFSVYLGRHTQPDGSDAKRAFILEAMPLAKFKEEYPKAKCEHADFDGVDSDMLGHFRTEETITVVEEYCLYPTRETIHFLADGTTISEEDYEKWPEEAGVKPTIQKTRTTTKEQLKWRKATGVEVLDSRDLPGKYIPIAEEIGRESWVDGRRIVWGLVRPAKDSLRMYNYWASTITEKMGLAPKNPFIGAVGQFSGLERQWKEANRKNRAYLEYNEVGVNGNAIPPPQRQGATPMEAAYFHFMEVIEHDVQTSLGMFKAAVGETESQQSGRAILALQKESDTGTYHFSANQGIMIRHVGRIILDNIPYYYDTKRVVRIIGEDGEVQTAHLDPEQEVSARQVQDPTTMSIKNIYNPSLGKYDIAITVGPSYNTKRMEDQAMFVEMAKGASDPGSAAAMRYLVVKNSDTPGAQEAAKIFKALMPPQALMALDSNEPIPPKAMAEMQKMRGQMQQMQEGMQKMQQENMQLKAGAQTQAMKIRADSLAEKAELELEARRIKLAKEKQDADIRLAKEKADAEIQTKRIVAAADLELEKLKIHMSSDAAVDAAIQKISAMATIHQAKVQAIFDKEKAAQEEGEKKQEASDAAGQIKAMQEQFMASIQEIVKSLTAKKTVSMTLPSGQTASAEVTMQ